MNIIETKRLILKEYYINDIPELNIILSDPMTMKFYNVESDSFNIANDEVCFYLS